MNCLWFCDGGGSIGGSNGCDRCWYDDGVEGGEARRWKWDLACLFLG